MGSLTFQVVFILLLGFAGGWVAGAVHGYANGQRDGRKSGWAAAHRAVRDTRRGGM